MKRFFVLDFYRTLAAIFVLLGHSGFQILGETVVNFFFVLSGFILAFRYQEDFDYKKFVIDRISRLFPLHWLSLVLVLICVGFNNEFVNLKNFLMNME